MKTIRETLNTVLVEIWDKESGIELYDQDYDNIDMTITMYKDNTYEEYESIQIDTETALKLVKLDMGDLFGYSEWMMGLYFLTQMELDDKLKDWGKQTFLKLFPDFTSDEYDRAITREKNEIRKLEYLLS